MNEILGSIPRFKSEISIKNLNEQSDVNKRKYNNFREMVVEMLLLRQTCGESCENFQKLPLYSTGNR